MSSPRYRYIHNSLYLPSKLYSAAIHKLHRYTPATSRHHNRDIPSRSASTPPAPTARPKYQQLERSSYRALKKKPSSSSMQISPSRAAAERAIYNNINSAPRRYASTSSLTCITRSSSSSARSVNTALYCFFHDILLI